MIKITEKFNEEVGPEVRKLKEEMNEMKRKLERIEERMMGDGRE